jgi:hypothetical protein
VKDRQGLHRSKFDRHLIMYKKKAMAHTHICPNCGTQWECGEANYQDECGKPTRTLCLRCWSLSAVNAPPRKPAPESAHAGKKTKLRRAS